MILRSAMTILMAGTVAGSAVAQEDGPGDAAALVSCSVQMVPMRDGVKLATDVYRPIAEGKYPVILQRTAYSGYRYSQGSIKLYAALVPPACKDPAMITMAARGYAVMNQDVRGTHRSEGEFTPVLNEGGDGYDAVEWAARQPYSTGKVGMMGGSYLGMAQWQAAMKHPPHLVTIVPRVAPVRFDSGWPYQAPNVLHHYLIKNWTAGVHKDQLYRQLTAAKVPEAEINARIDAYGRQANEAFLAPSLQGLPLAGDAIFDHAITSWYAQWLAHPTLDSYWTPSNVTDKFQTLSIPVLSLGAFYDVFVFGTVDGFTGIQQRGATPKARANARLILAGGGHTPVTEGYIGALSFGAENMIAQAETDRWFDYWLKGIDNGVMKEPAAKIYVMLPPDTGAVGSGFWATGDTFPLTGTKTVRYFLGGVHANTLAGGGTLSASPAATNGSDSFQFDPANPVQTIGGTTCCGNLVPAGAFDQRPVEIRPDVLVYTGEALTVPVPVIGEISVTLNASSSAVETLFTAKLVDVHPDGLVHNVSDGVVATNGTPTNKAGIYTIRMSPTATVFKPGHKIRLEISSSNYPRFPVTTNPRATAKDLSVATQTIFWKGTSLNLPVAPAAFLPAATR